VLMHIPLLRLSHQAVQIPFVQDDHVVKQVAPTTSNPAIRNTVLLLFLGCASPNIVHPQNESLGPKPRSLREKLYSTIHGI